MDMDESLATREKELGAGARVDFGARSSTQ